MHLELKPISQIAQELEIPENLLNLCGTFKSKITLGVLNHFGTKRGKLVLVTAVTPTPYGEGKTVTSIGLSSALSKLGRRSVVCLRQPSLGPLFGVKGGAAGGGRATVEPMQEINMRFTGDIDAMAAAHNLLSSMIDNHIFHGNELKISPQSVTWKRTVDMNDRALRQVRVGLENSDKSVPRDDGYVITAASEVMSLLCLSESYADIRERLGRIVVGYNTSGEAVRAADLRANGAMAALLKEALQPNLCQTSEGTPAIVHGGPFGNVSTGTCSLVSILTGVRVADYCVVEAGFGSDLGAEKFFDIVSQAGKFNVDAAVLVVSVRGLKHHSQGSPSMKEGLENLEKHIENIKTFGLVPVIAVNRFPADTDEEIRTVENACKNLGTSFAVSTVFECGAAGATDLAQLVIEAADKGYVSRPIYNPQESAEEKIRKIVTRIYGAEGADYEKSATEDLSIISKLGFGGLPVCVAKTALSLSDDPKKLGRPRSFRVNVSGVALASGAGLNIAHMGDIMTMPGLPKHPAAENIELLDDGTITGIF